MRDETLEQAGRLHYRRRSKHITALDESRPKLEGECDISRGDGRIFSRLISFPLWIDGGMGCIGEDGRRYLMRRRADNLALLIQDKGTLSQLALLLLESLSQDYPKLRDSSTVSVFFSRSLYAMANVFKGWLGENPHVPNGVIYPLQ